MLAKFWQELERSISAFGICVVLSLVLLGCSQPKATQNIETPLALTIGGKPQLEEVAPPEGIQQLRLNLDQYDPQVKILDLKPNETLENTEVSIKLQTRNFLIYKDAKLGLGPHLNVFLDNQRYQDVYNIDESLTFKDLSPGTHTIRAVAVRPWEESYKTAGASDQVTFQVFATTRANHPDPALPLLTLNSPQGTYGAEPILLDYTISSPSLQSEQASTISPWKVKVSVDGTSFTTSESAPIYLQGFKPGTHWVKVELLDQNSRPVENAFNEALKLMTLDPQRQDTLSQIVRGELTGQEAKRIVDRDLSNRLDSQEADIRQRDLAAELEKEKEVSREAEDKLKSAARPLAPKISAPSPAVSAPIQALQQPAPSAVTTPIPAREYSAAKTELGETEPQDIQISQKAPFWSRFKTGLQSSQPTKMQPEPLPGEIDLDEKDNLSEGVVPNLPPSSKPSSPKESVPAVPKLPTLKDSKAVMSPSALDEPELSPQQLSLQPSSKPSSKQGPLESVQKFLNYQPVDPEDLPVLQRKTVSNVPSRYIKKSESTQSAETQLSESDN